MTRELDEDFATEEELAGALADEELVDDLTDDELAEDSGAEAGMTLELDERGMTLELEDDFATEEELTVLTEEELIGAFADDELDRTFTEDELAEDSGAGPGMTRELDERGMTLELEEVRSDVSSIAMVIEPESSEHAEKESTKDAIAASFTNENFLNKLKFIITPLRCFLQYNKLYRIFRPFTQTQKKKLGFKPIFYYLWRHA